MATALLIVSEEELIQAIQSVTKEEDVRIEVQEETQEEMFLLHGDEVNIETLFWELSIYFECLISGYDGYHMTEIEDNVNGYVFFIN